MRPTRCWSKEYRQDVPLYEYECEACGKRFEVIQQKFSDAPVEVCRLCGKGPVRRLASSPAIQFKGSGFYITDYARKGTSEAGGAGSSAKNEKSDSSSEKTGDTAAKSDAPAKSETPAPATTKTTKETKE